jgi:hypothetical protein
MRNKQIAEQIANIAPGLRTVADHSHAEQAKIGDCIRAVFPCVVARPVAEPPSPELLHAALRQLEINSRVYPT